MPRGDGAGEQVLLDRQRLEAAPALQHLHQAAARRDRPGCGARHVAGRRQMIEPAVTWPRSAPSRLETALRKVVLPAPLAPRRATISPRLTVRLTPRRATMLWS